MGQRVAGGERRQRQCGGDGLIDLACVPQGANETVVRLNLSRRICGASRDGGAKGRCRFSGKAHSEQVESPLAVHFGDLGIGSIHG